MMRKKDWAAFAAACARDAHLMWFSSRRGVWYFEDCDVLVLYNNHPYKHPTLRAEELAEFRGRLRADGIEELAYATYPDDGYTYALVVDAGRDRERHLAAIMREITLKSLDRL